MVLPASPAEAPPFVETEELPPATVRPPTEVRAPELPKVALPPTDNAPAVDPVLAGFIVGSSRLMSPLHAVAVNSARSATDAKRRFDQGRMGELPVSKVNIEWAFRM
jgi:hypothetical protein